MFAHLFKVLPLTVLIVNLSFGLQLRSAGLGLVVCILMEAVDVLSKLLLKFG